MFYIKGKQLCFKTPKTEWLSNLGHKIVCVLLKACVSRVKHC